MKGSGFFGFIVNFKGSRKSSSVARLARSKAAEWDYKQRKEEGMKYVINGYQTIYDNGNRDKIKLTMPISTDDIESVRTKLKNKHSGIGKKCIGLNLDYTEVNDKV